VTVERVVKERLVGAAVLMAAAIILIPEMLSGPDRESHPADGAAAAPRSDAPIKTYTIDLSQSPGAQGAPAAVDNRAPPPEVPAAQPAAQQPAAGAQAKPESAQEPIVATSTPVQDQPTNEPAPTKVEQTRPVVEPPTSVPPASPRTEPHPLASSGNAPTSGAWVVQVGSFSKEATAQRLLQQLRAQGQSAFVMPVKSGGATLYRVRIGPAKDRASAEAVLRDVKSIAPGAAVVAHP
jgi:DedD protein